MFTCTSKVNHINNDLVKQVIKGRRGSFVGIFGLTTELRHIHIFLVSETESDKSPASPTRRKLPKTPV